MKTLFGDITTDEVRVGRPDGYTDDGPRLLPRTAAVCPAGDSPGEVSSRLESSPNKRKLPPEPTPLRRFHMCQRGCRCRTCPDCGPRYGWKVRQRLLQKSGQFIRPALFTLTVDRKVFGGPLDAFLTITGDGYIRRLMRLLGVERWLWTLELQMKSGEGWPHWHMVIDLPAGGLDLSRAWRLWRDKWGLGGLDLQRKDNRNAEHALFYVTKYLTKYPKEGFPDWILHLDRRIRWVQACRKLGPVVSDREKTTADVADDDEASESLPTHPHRPLAVRMAGCGEMIDFLETDADDPERYRFVGRLPRGIVDSALDSFAGPKRHQLDKMPPHIEGRWETFAELAGDLCRLGISRGSRWLLKHRSQRIKDAGKRTREGGRDEAA